MQKRRLQMLCEALFLAFFVFSLLGGVMILWLAVFVSGLALSLYFGRLYCGWICPINTCFRAVGWLCKRLHLSRKEPPKMLRRRWIKWSMFLLMVLLLLAGRLTSLNIPVFLYFLVIGVASASIFQEALFHSYLCPYGALLEAASKYAKCGVAIRAEKCVGCGACRRVCPNDAISQTESGTFSIKASECLTCFRCEKACPSRAIFYQRVTKKAPDPHTRLGSSRAP